MGTLLRPEAELADAIGRARAEFVSQRIRPQTLPGFDMPGEQGELDLSGVDDDTFFIEAEQRLIDALHDYAARGAGAQAARRRLFAGDAGQGVALLELLRQRYDVVLMNPPFGAGSLQGEEGLSTWHIRRPRMMSTPLLSSEASSFWFHAACSARSRRVQVSSCRASRSGEKRLFSRKRHRWCLPILGRVSSTARWLKLLLIVWSDSDEGSFFRVARMHRSKATALYSGDRTIGRPSRLSGIEIDRTSEVPVRRSLMVLADGTSGDVQRT